MRLLLRTVDGAGRRLDLRVDAVDDATVGELADHLASFLGQADGLSVISCWPLDRRDHPPPRDCLVATDGPRSGSTVALVDPPEGSPPTPPAAPVRLVGTDGDCRNLHYGSNPLGDVVLHVDDHVRVRATAGAPVRVNGNPLLGNARLGSGDLVTTGERVWVVHLDGELRVPQRSGGLVEHRASGEMDDPAVPTAMVLPTPPGSTRLPGFPVLSAMVPLLMGGALWVATRSIAAVVFVLFSFVFVVASGVEARREAKAERRFRLAEWRTDLGDVVVRIEAARNRQLERSAQRTPPAGSVDPERIWERGGDGPEPPSLRVRIGAAHVVTFDPILVPDSGRRELRLEAADVADRLGHLEDAVTVDLRATGGLLISGGDEHPTGVAISIAVQLASLVPPEDLRIIVLSALGRAEDWRWASWLPHTASDAPRASTVVIADGADPDAIQRCLETLGAIGICLVQVCGPRAPRPEGLDAELRLEDRAGTLVVRHHASGAVERIEQISVDTMGRDEAEPLARMLSPLVLAPPLRLRRSGRQVTQRPSRLPQQLRLAEVISDPRLLRNPELLARRWDHNAGSAAAIPLGAAEGGGIVHLDLDSDGPHALIAGTTGSGKSELLRTFIASAALHLGPEDVTFLLVDYKGGAAFQSLTALPHTVGMITDLNEQLARRALVSLRAEVRRREELVADRDASAWTGAALVVVVDEFATMAREIPEFVDGLVDVAQRGRSLGIHLVLATQRPAGVVTDSIRANTTLRLALRVADEDDSRDVVDSPIAATFPRTVPGRAVLRAGPTRSATVQIAYSSGPAVERQRLLVTRLEDAPTARAGNTISELDLCVATARSAAEIAAIAPPRRPWLDPLPERIDAASANSILTGADWSDRGVADRSQEPEQPGTVVIGVVDRPDLQARRPLAIDLERDGGVMVLGASGSGRTSMLMSLVLALDRHPDEQIHVHAIDAATGLGELTSLGSVGDVVAVDDIERVLRLLRSTSAELTRRIAAGGRGATARRVVVVDGIGSFEETYERIDRGEAVDLLARLVRDGRSVGIHVALSAHRRSEVPAAVAGGLGARLHLRCANEDDAALAGLPPESADPDLPPGRCWFGPHVAQLIQPDLDPDAAIAGTGHDQAPPIARLPFRIDAAELSPSSGWQLAMGLDADELATAHLDLTHHHALVAGPPRTGCTTALAMVAAAHGSAVLLRPRTGSHDFAAWSHVDDDPQRWCAAALDAASTGHPTLALVDDLPDWLDGADAAATAAALAQLLQAARSLPIRLVVAGEVDALTRCYDESLIALRAGRTGLLLGGDPDVHASLFHTSVAVRSDLPGGPGRGWLLAPSASSRVQVALPPAAADSGG